VDIVKNGLDEKSVRAVMRIFAFVFLSGKMTSSVYLSPLEEHAYKSILP
jgi:hypothetical protein